MKINHPTQDYTRWNLPEGAKARLGTGYLTGNMLYSPDGTQLIVPTSMGIWIHNASTLEAVNLITEYRPFTLIECSEDSEPIDAGNAVGFSSDGNLFGISVEWLKLKLPRDRHETYVLQIWTSEVDQLKSISIECPEKVNSMVFSPDGTTLSGSKDGTIYLWNVHTGELQNTLTAQGKIDSMVFSPDSSTLASTSWVGTDQLFFSASEYYIDVWNIRTGKHKFSECRAVGPLAFSSDSSILASKSRVDWAWALALWNIETGLHKFNVEDYFRRPMLTSIMATSLVFSPDGFTLASFSPWFVDDSLSFYPDKIQLWDLDTGNCKSTFTGPGDITSLVFSPDGRTLAGGCKDGTVLLWDVDDDNPFIIDISYRDSDNNETTLEEKDSEFPNRVSQIQKICEDRSITTLVHFTQIKHLRSILHEGLLDHQSLLEKHGQQFVPNDKQRIDGHKEAICLSISFPNYPLFSKFSWSDNNGRPDYSGWIVLLLDAKVLWELDCAFCQENAASNAVRYIPLEDRKNPDALEGMFVDVCRDTKGNVYQRQSLQISDDYPTHPQSEVLVFNQIPSDYIKEVHFYDETILKQWCDNNPWINPERLLHNQQCFQYGRDQLVRQDDNLDDDIPFDDDLPF